MKTKEGAKCCALFVRFCYPYSLAGCAPVDLNLIYSALLISWFFSWRVILCLCLFQFFWITLSVGFFFSLNCSACNEPCCFFSYASFVITQKPTPLSNGLARRPLSCKYFLAFSTPLSEVVYFTFLAYLFEAASI